MDGMLEQRKQEMLAECQVDEAGLAGVADRVAAFVVPFVQSLSNAERGHAQDYVRGLASDLERKNVESIAYYHEQDRQALQRFVGALPWNHGPLLAELGRQVGQRLGEPDGVIILDPSAFTKKGKASVGVQRQWNGRLGKNDNCQVGVYLAYASRIGAALTNVRLYLPKSWTDHKTRCRNAGVPREVEFQTKLEQARAMLTEQGGDLPHTWVVGDDDFGRSTQFRRNLRADREQYLLAVPSNTLVRNLEMTETGAEQLDPQRGPFQRVDRWAQALPAEAWTSIDVRDGAKGPVLMEVVVTRALAITERTQEDAVETLVVTRRQEGDRVVLDYWLSNAPGSTPRAEFARVANRRQAIEQCLQLAKGQAGLADYEVRTWQGWHHHQALSLLAAWFLTVETLGEKKERPSDDGPATPHRDRQSAHPIPRPLRCRTHRPRLPTPTRAQRTRSLLPPQKTQPVTATSSCATKLD